MQLVEMAARKMKEWAELGEFIYQGDKGYVFSEDGILLFYDDLAEDWIDAKVTHAQWEAERERILEKSSRFTEEDKANIESARIAANQQATKEAREIARTGSMTSEEQELADIACGKRSKEDQEKIKEVTSFVSVGYTLERDYEAEEAKQYEQELWDKVALASTQAFITGHISHFGHENVWQATELVSCAAYYADAFMAERAKRMKG